MLPINLYSACLPRIDETIPGSFPSLYGLVETNARDFISELGRIADNRAKAFPVDSKSARSDGHTSQTTRNPVCAVVLSGELPVRAAILYRQQ